jgi:hypothetical protein
MFQEDATLPGSDPPKPSAPDTEILLHFGRGIISDGKIATQSVGAIKHV